MLLQDLVILDKASGPLLSSLRMEYVRRLSVTAPGRAVPSCFSRDALEKLTSRKKKKKLVEQKNYKEEIDATFPVYLKKTFKNMQASLVYRRQERNTNRTVMQVFKSGEKFPLMQEVQPTQQSSSFLAPRPCFLLGRSFGSPVPYCLDLQNGNIDIMPFCRGGAYIN